MTTTAKKKIEHIALGSDRAAKIMAVRASIARIAEVDSAWRNVNIVARPVQTDTPAMPLNDWELMSGARQRALAVREILLEQRLGADLYVGLEGGFHSISVDGEWHTFLRGWAFVSDGKRGSFGMSPSIQSHTHIQSPRVESMPAIYRRTVVLLVWRRQNRERS